jgi:hypothetical protein
MNGPAGAGCHPLATPVNRDERNLRPPPHEMPSCDVAREAFMLLGVMLCLTHKIPDRLGESRNGFCNSQMWKLSNSLPHQKGTLPFD